MPKIPLPPWLEGALRSPLAPLAGGGAVAILLTMLLVWPMPLELGSRTLAGPFHDGHVWCFWQMTQIVEGSAQQETSAIGWPTTVQTYLIGWGPGLMVAPLQGLLGPVGAYNASLLLSAGLNALLAALLCRALGALPAQAAAGGLIVALCPYALDALANGQVVKLQIWILVLHLLVVWLTTRVWWSLPLVIPASLLLGFTSPSLAMSLPFALAVLVPAFAWSSPQRLRAAACGAASVGLTAKCLIWVSKIYDLEPPEADQSAFFPANVREGDYHALLDQIARIDSVFLGGVPSGFHADHVPYLGLAAIVIGVFCSRRAFEGRVVGWLLMTAGVTLALGPRLADGTGFVSMGSASVAMPAALLELIDYPVVRSGMYHRFLVLASLGVALLVACGTSALPRWGGRAAWLFAAILIGDALFQSRDRWPLQSQPVPGLTTYAEMAADPEPGAVVVLPLRVNDTGGGTQIMLSTFHGRATSGLPRYDYWQRSEAPEALLGMFESASAPEKDAQAVLSTEGIRYVLWAPWIKTADGGPGLQDLQALLGPPQVDGELRWWRIEAD